MATLTEISLVARKGIKWGAIALVIIMLIPGSIKLLTTFLTKLNPPPPPAPTVKYGRLPRLIFPIKEAVATPEYKLETIEGGLPAVPNVGKVYLVGINKSRLLTPDRIKEKARLLGFLNEPVPLNEQTYKFIHPTIPAEMVSNIISGGFSYRFDWTSDKSIATTKTPPISSSAISEAKTWLQALNLLPADLASGRGEFKYFVATGSAMLPIDTYYDANFTRVDLFRDDKDKLKVVTAGGDTSPVNVTFTSIAGNKRVVQANYQYSKTLDNDFATYPLKSIVSAWSELTGGGGYIAKRAGSNVTVRKAYLAYYESNDPQDFLQPVFVFEGDGGFMGYVQAVDQGFVQ
jgi:hypothetical protein